MVSSDTQPYELITRRVLDELNDVTIISPVLNNILRYDGSNWVNIADYSVLDSIIFSTGLSWDFLTKTLTLLNPLPAISIPNSTLTTNALGVPQWISFSVGSASKPGILTYNGISFSAAQLTT